MLKLFKLSSYKHHEKRRGQFERLVYVFLIPGGAMVMGAEIAQSSLPTNNALFVLSVVGVTLFFLGFCFFFLYEFHDHMMHKSLNKYGSRGDK